MKMENHLQNSHTKFRYKRKILNITSLAFVILLPIVTFFVLLNINLPIPILKVINNNSIFAFFIILGLYCLCFQLRGKASWLSSLMVTIIIFAAPLAFKWLTGYSDAKVIGSFIPYKDGYHFYQGARTLLLGRPIIHGFNDAYHLLFPQLLSSLLLFTNNNLLITLAGLVLFMGFICNITAEQVKSMFGKWPAALFMTLMVLFSRQFIGLTASGIPGVFLACLAFILLLRGAEKQKVFELCLGAIILVFSLSIRTGALFILPAVVFWAGFVFKKKKAFDWKTGLVFFLSVSITYVCAIILIPKIMVVLNSDSRSNMANLLYGLARGGAGINQAGLDFPGENGSFVMREALTFIQHHPLGLIVGIIKSYYYFVAPTSIGILSLTKDNSQIIQILIWIMFACLTIAGIVYCARQVKKPVFSLILACLVGLLLSIPFVSPIDLGNRIYAGGIPFFYVLPALGLLAIWNNKKEFPREQDAVHNSIHIFAKAFSFFLIFLLIVLPLMIRIFRKAPDFVAAKCSKSQIPFAFQIYKGSYVDIIKETPPSCGRAPIICLDDFEKNGIDQKNDDFFRFLAKEAENSETGIRVTAAVDLISSGNYFFTGPPELMPSSNPQGLIVGCAVENDSRYQKVLWIENIVK